MPKPYDATTKYLVEGFPADWLTFAGLGPIGRVDVIDANLSTITAEADKVFRVDGPESWLAHIELQTSHEGHLPRRLLRYNTLLDDRHDLPTRSIVILLRPQADGDDLTGVYRRSLPGGPNFLEFRYDVIRVWEQPVEPLLNGGLGTLPMALVADLGELDPPEVVRRLADRIDREPKEDAALLWSATAILMGLRFGRDEITQLLRGVRDMKESVFYQMILEEGEAKGEAKGKIKGKIEGKIEEAQRILLFIGSDRWGEPDPAVIEMVESLGDLGRVEALIKKSNRSSSWEELLAEPLPDQAGS